VATKVLFQLNFIWQVATFSKQQKIWPSRIKSKDNINVLYTTVEHETNKMWNAKTYIALTILILRNVMSKSTYSNWDED